MIVVLVYRPEAVSGAGVAEQPHNDVPFEGIEVYGSYYEAESAGVDEMVMALSREHPGWHFHIEPNVKSYVGFHPERLKVPARRSRSD